VAIRMRTTLLLSLLTVSFGLTVLSLLVLRTTLQRQIRRTLASDLHRSVLTFENLQTQRREMLRHNAALLADLPTLKALMTLDLPTLKSPTAIGDERTIQDGGAHFAQVSGSPFFALASRSGKVIACYVDGLPVDPAAAAPDMQGAFPGAAGPHYVLTGGRLYEVNSEPLYFGSPASGTLLGYVTVGGAIDDRLAFEVSEAAAAQVVFSADDAVVASTFDPAHKRAFAQQALARRSLAQRKPQPVGTPNGNASVNAPHANARNGNVRDGSDIWIGPERYLEASVKLSGEGAPVVQLAVLKSYAEASRYLNRLNQLLIALGLLVFLTGGVLAIYISGTITHPLEMLVAGSRALGAGNFDYPLPSRGAKELRELSAAFDDMRTQLRQAQQNLLDVERLATIGRMASSISHDLRHYLSAVYANAEFLGSWTTRPEERAELLAEVRMGVQGMTELIESLLIFSRTGQPLQLSCESIGFVTERAIALVKAHPDAQNVTITADPLPSLEIWMDGRKIERAIYNLLLNACQAARHGVIHPAVRIVLSESQDWIKLSIMDSGLGVSAPIRSTLFQPFVSEGKQNGIGLGLTLADRIAQEHGGRVVLEESQPGRTVFSLTLAKSTLRAFETAAREQRSATSLSPN
jgi:signal transduction histidine kinase